MIDQRAIFRLCGIGLQRHGFVTNEARLVDAGRFGKRLAGGFVPGELVETCVAILRMVGDGRLTVVKVKPARVVYDYVGSADDAGLNCGSGQRYASASCCSAAAAGILRRKDKPTASSAPNGRVDALIKKHGPDVAHLHLLAELIEINRALLDHAQAPRVVVKDDAGEVIGVEAAD